MNTIKKIISTFVLLSLVFPYGLRAQEVTPEVTPEVITEPVSEEIIITEAISAEVAQESDASEPNDTPQSAASSQESTQNSDIQETFDPSETISEAASSTPIEVPSSPATSTTVSIPDPLPPLQSPAALPDVEIDIENDGVVEEDQDPVITEIEEVETPVVESIVVGDGEDDVKWSFQVRGGVIPTKKDPRWHGEDGSLANITETPSLNPDNQSGVLGVSGECSEKYFVVLLYAKMEDYDANPSSYVFNKAFNCRNGVYNYSIKDLPASLPFGTYYLLIAGQGDTGSWSPTSALVPIIINRE